MPVTFKRLQNTGKGHLNQPLGSVAITGIAAVYYATAVELEFLVPADVRKLYTKLTVRQFAGPDVIWKKTGDMLQSKWILVGRDTLGANQNDRIEPECRFSTSDGMGYYDSPGPNVLSYLGKPISRLYVVQLFTGWIDGTPVRGGAPQRLCPVVSWHSRVNIANANWQKPTSTPDWQWIYPHGSGQGWLDLKLAPQI